MKKREAKGSTTGRQEALRVGCIILSLLLDAFVVMLCVEYIGMDAEGAFVWMGYCGEFVVLELGLIFSVLAALTFLLGRPAPALFLGNGVFLLLAVVNKAKLNLRGDVVVFSDLELAGEGIAAGLKFGREALGLSYRVLGMLGVMIVLVPLLFVGLRLLRGRPVSRAACVLLACALGAASATRENSLEFQYFSTKEEYQIRGLAAGFLSSCFDMGIGHQLMPEPEDYGAGLVAQALQPYRGEGRTPDVLPNILFIMSESLYDIAGDLQLSEDPIAYFKELQGRFWGGSLLVPTLGGGTSRTEYEVLTGYSVADTQGLSYSIRRGVIRRNMDSVVSLLERYGYQTHALHPNAGSFFNRRTVYAMLGFDGVDFREELPAAPEGPSHYPSDEYLFEQIISAYERRTPGRPWFCHAVTYQNHGGYDYQTGLSRVQVFDELGEQEMLNASTYVNLLKLSDDALRSLIAYFDAQQEPMVIVMWGDHAPGVQQFGISLPQNGEEQTHYYTTPLLIYSNYGLQLDGMPALMRSYRLGAEVMRALGFDGDAYFNYLSSEDAAGLMTINSLVCRDGVLMADEELRDRQSRLQYLLHYDRVFGRRYGKEMPE